MKKNYYPKVGETFYWENLEGEIHEDKCFKIEGEDIPTLETMFFISLSENGGGTFVTESDILNPNSKKVIKFKKELAKQKAKEITDYISQKEIREILFNRLSRSYYEDDANEILDILSKDYE